MARASNPLQNARQIASYLVRQAANEAARRLNDPQSRERLQSALAASALVVLYQVDRGVDGVVEWLQRQQAVSERKGGED